MLVYLPAWANVCLSEALKREENGGHTVLYEGHSTRLILCVTKMWLFKEYSSP